MKKENIVYTDNSGRTSTISSLSIELIKEIKSIREDKEISLTELAYMADTNKAQLSKFFNFKVNMSLYKVLQIIDVLGYKVQLVSKHKK